MADNTTLNSMTGGDVVASDDIAGVKFQRIKLVHGADGVNDGDVSNVNPLPVDITYSSSVIETTTATLANGAAYTTAWLDSSHQGKTFSLIAIADKQGFVEHEESIDGSTVAWVHSTEYKAGEYYHVDHVSFARYSRFRFTNNSGSAQTAFKFGINQTVFPQAQVLQNAYDMDTTQTPLTGSATYTTKTFNTKTGGPAMTFICVADQNGTLYLDESVDGVTWDVTATSTYTSTTVFNEMHTAHANFFRIRLVNGASAQGYLRMQIIQRFNGIPWMIKLDPNQAEVYGNKTSNTAAPVGDNFGVLPAVCHASAPTYTDTYQVGQSVTTSGDTRITLDGEAVVLGAGTAGIGKLTANSGVDIGDVDVITLPGIAGTVAHGGSDTGNPIKIGGRADTTFQTAATDGQRVDALFDVYGQIRVRTDHANLWKYHENSSSALTDASVQAAPGAGLSVYVTDIVFSTGAATACNIFLEEGASTILGPYYLEGVAGRGIAIHFQTPHKCTANTAVTVTTSAAIAHGLDIKGYIAP